MSCPSCGRTLFDLQEISAEIRDRTSHLPGVSVITSSSAQRITGRKCTALQERCIIYLCLLFSVQIAIMGCIVNGPGEMADADFGYVGGAPGKIDLYVGKVSLFDNLSFGKMKTPDDLSLICDFNCSA